ncbi:MBG domain-containing protein [Prevotella sp. P6B1]|uniref:MBG domain-containing protein n=1 Tax=Prevotella sp. P6B1 TaxID=1410613 RepID=UPI0018CC4E9F|nr:MBG domain-containing protein [Prevotella sp. P6B1]
MKCILAGVLLCLGMGARAGNTVTISSTEGAPGDEVTISVGLQNSDAVSSLQVSIPLNENLTLVEGSGLLGNRCGNHQLTVGVKDGVLNVFVYSMSMASISGNSGEVASFKLKLGNQPLSATLAPSKLVLTNSASTPVSASSQSGTVTIRCAKAQYSATEIDFGAVPIRETYQQTVTVTNIGNADLKITNLVFSDVMTFFSSTTLPLTIGAGESRDINITYQPTERGNITKSLKVECNSSSKLNTIQLKAQPFAVNELHVQPASGISDEEVTVSMTMNNMDAISGLQLEFTLPEQLQYVDNSFALSSRKQDHHAVASLNGNVVRIIAYSGNDKPFTGEDGEIGSFKVKLVGRYGVTLTPTKTVLSATINNKVENVLSQVYGGEITIQSPTISCDDALDFGAVAVTETCEKTFTINNDGSAPLTINRIVFNNENLSIKESLPIVIPASSSSNVTVVYSSEEQKAFEAKMQIYSNDPDLRLKEVTVRGSRFAPNYLALRADDVFPHENLSIDLELNTYDPIMGLQFDMEYSGEYYEAFDNNYKLESRAEGMTVDTRQIDSNTLRVFCYFLSGNGIAPGNGKVMSLLLKPKNENIPQGSYNVKLKNIIFSAENLTDKYAGTDTQCSFVVLDGSLVTITAKSVSRQYGSDNPTLEYETTGAALFGEPEITCSATSSSNAGSYNIVVSKGSVRNKNVSLVNGTLTVTSKIVETPSITLSQTSYTYDGTAKEPTVTVKDGGTTIPTSEYSVSYTNNTNVGTATVTITDVDGGNYAVSGSTTFAISSADGSLTPPAGKSDLVYTGTAQDLITAGSTTTGTLQYSLDGTTYSTTIPQGINAGSYIVYYKVKGDANHNDIAAQHFTVIIAAKTVESPTITLSQTSYTYDGTAKEPTVTVKDGGTTIPATEYSVSYTNNTNVGTATVTITDVDGGNYAVSGSTTFVISSADGSLTPPAGKSDLVYTGTAQDLITAGSTTTGTMQYSLDGTNYSTQIPQGTNAGGYTVYYKVKGDANHNDIAAQHFSVIIAAKTVENPTITLSQTSYTYDGTAKEPTVTVKDGGTTIPATEYSVSYTNNTNVGTATVTITDVDGGNYAVSGSTTFAISSADGSLTPPAGKSDLVYTGAAQDLITAGSTTTGTMQYSLDGTNYSTQIPQGINAGSYIVYYKVKGDANHNDIAAQHFMVIIAAKTVENPTITLSQTSYTYDGTAKEPTVTVKDGGTTIPVTEYSVSYTNNTNVGTATVTITDVDGGNYAVSGSTTFAISSADGSLTPPAGKSDLVYTGAAQDLITAGSTTTGTMQYSLDGTTYSTTIPQGTNAGSYTVYYKVKGDANHNDIAAQHFTVIIAAKAVENPTITLSQTSYTYDGTAKEPAVTVKDGGTTIPTSEYSVSYTNNTDVGTATVTITDVDGGNYAVSGSTTFAISSADGSLTPPAGKSDLVYTGAAQDLITAGSTTTGTMQYSLDGTTYAATIPQGTNAGSYTVYYKVKGDANHNDIAAQHFTVIIAAKTVETPTITLSQTSYTYDGTAKEPAVAVKDGGTTIPATEYSVSYTNNTNVGTATVTITDVDGGNYAVSGSTTFAISSADGSLTPPAGKSDLVYTGAAQDLITAGSTTTGTMQYSLDGTNYSTQIPQGTNAGSYTVYYKVKGDANHNDIAAQNFRVTIAKALLTVSVGNYEMTEGESVPRFTISYDGFVNNETVAVLTIAPTASCEATSESKPGTYAITISGGVAKNYSFSYSAGTLTIKTKKTFVDDNSGSGEGEDDNSAEYTINESSGGESEENTVAITNDEGVKGAFSIPETVEHNGTSYTVTEIGESAFENNKDLTDVTIPSSITTIGDKSFKGCSNLKSITVYITTPISLSGAAARGMMTRAGDSSIFDGVDKATCILYVPEGSVELYKAAPVWCEFQNILAIGSTGINGIIMNGEPQEIYDLQGHKVKAKATTLEGLPRGVYIVNGKKIVLK